MADLTPADLASIRDEVGTTIPPTDRELKASYVELGYWRLVAIRVLKRRRAALAAGGIQSISIPGAVSVSLRSDLKSLTDQISRLESEHEAATGEDLPGGASNTVLRRRVAR